MRKKTEKEAWINLQSLKKFFLRILEPLVSVSLSPHADIPWDAQSRRRRLETAQSGKINLCFAGSKDWKLFLLIFVSPSSLLADSLKRRSNFPRITWSTFDNSICRAKTIKIHEENRCRSEARLCSTCKLMMNNLLWESTDLSTF